MKKTMRTLIRRTVAVLLLIVASPGLLIYGFAWVVMAGVPRLAEHVRTWATDD